MVAALGGATTAATRWPLRYAASCPLLHTAVTRRRHPARQPQVTNYHVIQDASDIQVTALGGDEYSARVIGVDRDKDIAVLQVGGHPGVATPCG